MLRKFKGLIIGAGLALGMSSNVFALEGWPNFSGNDSVIEILKPGPTPSTDGFQYDLAEHSTITKAELLLLQGISQLPKLKLGFNLTAIEQIDENHAKYAFHLFQNGKFDLIKVTLVREKIEGAETHPAIDAEHHNKSIKTKDITDALAKLWEKVKPFAEEKAKELWPQIEAALVNKVVPWLQSNLLPQVEKMAKDVFEQILARFKVEDSSTSTSADSGTSTSTDSSSSSSS